MMSRKEIENIRDVSAWMKDTDRASGLESEIHAVATDAIAKHDALLEIYHLLGGEGEPEDVVETCKKLANKVVSHLSLLSGGFAP